MEIIRYNSVRKSVAQEDRHSWRLRPQATRVDRSQPWWSETGRPSCMPTSWSVQIRNTGRPSFLASSTAGR